MTQPRKEQVKNLKTKYTRFTSVGALSLGGGPVQTVSNTALEGFYDNFLAAMKTGAVGGAESSAPAILYGGSGPFSLSAGNSFTLTITGVNGGNPMTVAVQAGDIVTLGGLPVVTTSRMADRINQVVFGFGVTAAVAANVNGQLVLTSAGATGVLVGDSVVITATEVTPGILNVLGLSSTSAASAQGVTAPRRGVVTVSADGLGGVVQLRKIDSVVSDAVNSSMRHAVAGQYVPEFAHGQPVYARLQAFPGPVLNGRNLRFSYFRNGPVRPRVVTSSGVNKSNFSTLSGADSVAVNLNYGNGQTLSFNVTFSGITTVQGVVDKFNLALAGASQGATLGQIDSTLPQVIARLAGPYTFTSTLKDSFFFTLNGNAPIHVSPAPGIYSASQMATLIGTAIGTAGQAGQGQGFTYTAPDGSVYFGIRSVNSDVTASSVRILPGNPGGSTPGSHMETLDMLGLTPGLYRAGTVAQLYGLDEVELHCSSPLPGANLTIAGSPATMAKLGLPSGVNVSVTNGVQPAVAPTSHALIPEMVEFHEERDDYDSIVQDFDNKSGYNQLSPQDGTANVGLDQMIGMDGKLNPSLLPRILDFLGLDQVKLGSKLGTLLSSTLTPKIQATHGRSETGLYNLLFESSADMTGASGSSVNTIVRVYTLSGSVLITVNARMVAASSSPAAFTRDAASDSFILNLTDGVFKVGFWRQSDSSTWGLSDWKTSAQIDALANSSNADIVRVGDGLRQNSGEALKARLGLSAPNILFTLLAEARGPEASRIRVYAKLGEDNEGDVTGTSILMVTVNARWDGSQWNKDTSSRASMFSFSNDGLDVFSRGDDTPWSESDWDVSHLSLNYNSLSASIGGSVSVGDNIIDQPHVPVIRGFRFADGVSKRQLLFQSDQAGPFANVPIRIYMLTGTGFYGQGFEFTYNARWEGGLNLWYPDDFAEKSYSWIMAKDRFWFLSKDALGSSWDENPSLGWSKYSVFDHNAASTPGHVVRDGVFRVEQAGATSNPVPSAAVNPNTVYAKSMIKAWGKIRGDGPFTFNVSLLDGFNCNFTGYDGGAGAYAASFATVMLNTHYAVQFSGRATNGGTPPVEPGSWFVWSGSKLHLYSAVLIGQANYGFSYYPLVGANGAPSASLGDIRGHFMYFTVIGAQ